MTRSKNLTYKRWKGMKSRCYAPSFNNTQNKYQSLGIKVCDRWLNSFENFLEDMGECEEGFSLERINPLKDYSPDNCKWIPISEQAKNRTSCKFYRIGEYNYILKDWSKIFNIDYNTLRERVLKRNMPLTKAIFYTAAYSKKYKTNMTYPEIFEYYINKNKDIV